MEYCWFCVPCLCCPLVASARITRRKVLWSDRIIWTKIKRKGHLNKACSAETFKQCVPLLLRGIGLCWVLRHLKAQGLQGNRPEATGNLAADSAGIASVVCGRCLRGSTCFTSAVPPPCMGSVHHRIRIRRFNSPSTPPRGLAPHLRTLTVRPGYVAVIDPVAWRGGYSVKEKRSINRPGRRMWPSERLS